MEKNIRIFSDRREIERVIPIRSVLKIHVWLKYACKKRTSDSNTY